MEWIVEEGDHELWLCHLPVPELMTEAFDYGFFFTVLVS